MWRRVLCFGFGVIGMLGCGGPLAEDADELCEEALSADGKVRCRDTTMVEVSRAYRMPDGELRIILEGEKVRGVRDFYIELKFNEAAQQQAPQIWTWMGSSGLATTFYDRERSAQARNDHYPFPPENGTLTISTYEPMRIAGSLTNFRYEDNAELRGVALVPTMRFDISCVGDPVNDDPSCADACGVCVANDRCGNEVVVPVEPCP